LSEPANPGQTGFHEVDAEPFDYSLRLMPDGRYVLAVVANQSAFYYFREHELTSAEVSEYRTRGKPFLSQLARRVRHEQAGGPFGSS